MTLPKPYGEAVVFLQRGKEKLNLQNELMGLHHSVATQEVALINFIHSMAGTGIRTDNWVFLQKPNLGKEGGEAGSMLVLRWFYKAMRDPFQNLPQSAN